MDALDYRLNLAGYWEKIVRMTYQDEDALKQEETKHARRGCILALVLLPLVCICVLVPIQAWTSIGQATTAQILLYYTYVGLPIPSPYLQGLPTVARSGCELDRTNPRPPDYNTRRERLQIEYDSLRRIYDQYWNQLRSNGGDTSSYPPPSQIPGEFNSATLFFCR